MIIYILHDNRYYTFRLPKAFDGSYVLYDYDRDNFKRNLVSVVGNVSKWMMKSNSNAKIFVNNEFVDSVEINLYSLYMITTSYNENVYIYASPGYDDSFISKKMIGDRLVFGSDSSCDVVLQNTSIAAQQFEICKVGNSLLFRMLDKSSFLYINGKKYKEKIINNFDLLFINGFKILFCSDVLFMNDPNSFVHISSNQLEDLLIEYAVEDYDRSSASFSDFYESSDYFSKSPVFRKKLSTLKVTITSPEEKEQKGDSSFIMSIVPSMFMSLTTLLSGYYSIKNYSSGTTDRETLVTTLVMCIVMIFVSVAWPFIERFAETIRVIIHNMSSNIKYKNYLKRKRAMLVRVQNDQKTTLQFNNLSLLECQDAILKRTSNLFSITPEQSNFLNVKLGVGKVKMDCEFDYTKPDFI